MRLLAYMQMRYQISRRSFVSLIKQRYVFVNGKLITSYIQEVCSGDKINIQTPNFTIDEIVEEIQKKTTLILFNKPSGYVVSKYDPHNKTIYDILPHEFKNYYYIGRLDKYSHGLLLLTDNPGLVNEYEHPKYGIEKEYVIELDRPLEPSDLQKAVHGMYDAGEFLRALKITVFKKPHHYSVVLNEGKKRHIRRMFKMIGYRVEDLQRIREGKYVLEKLQPGERKIINTNV